MKLILTFSLLFFVSCSLFESSDEEALPINIPMLEISGKIVFPEKTTVDTNGLHIISILDEVEVQNGTYNLNTMEGEFITHYLKNQSDKVVLLGYSYPGDNTNTIDVKSTALALVMESFLVYSLDKNAKLNLINEIKKDSLFSGIISEVSKLLEIGNSIIDESNVELISAVENLFEDLTEQRRRSVDPVSMNIEENVLTFTNLGRAHYSVVGIYKDGVQLAYDELKPIKVSATSLWEMLDGLLFGDDAPLDSWSYEIMSDGRYEIKIRTGKPDYQEYGFEDNRAFDLNYSFMSSQIIEQMIEYLKLLDNCYFTALLTAVDISIEREDYVEVDTEYKFGKEVRSFLSSSVPDGVDIATQCSLDLLGEILKKYYVEQAQLLAMQSGTLANFYSTAYHLYRSKPAIDFCVEVYNNSVSFCPDTLLGTLVDNRNGQTYKTVQIGKQNWMAENLNYEVENTRCYDDLNSNCEKYGKYYNWEVALDACPENWHLPSKLEWQELIDFLGGENIAGGKLKETGDLHWKGGNLYATNESGFTGLPGGAHEFANLPNEDFSGIGFHGDFWSSSEFNTENGWYLTLWSLGGEITLHTEIIIRCMLFLFDALKIKYNFSPTCAPKAVYVICF